MSATESGNQEQPQSIPLAVILGKICKQALEQGIPCEAILGTLEMVGDDIKMLNRQKQRSVIVKASMLPPNPNNRQ